MRTLNNGGDCLQDLDNRYGSEWKWLWITRELESPRLIMKITFYFESKNVVYFNLWPGILFGKEPRQRFAGMNLPQRLKDVSWGNPSGIPGSLGVDLGGLNMRTSGHKVMGIQCISTESVL
jgi:hypothetical protein